MRGYGYRGEVDDLFFDWGVDYLSVIFLWKFVRLYIWFVYFFMCILYFVRSLFKK